MITPLCVILMFFSEVCSQLGSAVPSNVLVQSLGDTVTLPCSYAQEGDVAPKIGWIKHPLGQKPQLVAMIMHTLRGAKFFNEFQNSKRLSAKKGKGTFNLTLSYVELSDSATYYCIVMHFENISIGEATTLMVMGSESQSKTVVLQQPESESVQLGDSLTLQCTVLTQTCAGEHSVYWFRQGSGGPHPGIIYTLGNRSGECHRSSGPVPPTQSCVYNFPKRYLSLSDAGTYYCAVETCGEILFGNGTKLDVKGIEAASLYCLVGALALSVILHIVLALRRKSHENCKETEVASNNPELREDLSSEEHQDDPINYAAMTFTTKKPDVRRNKREVKSVRVYSDITFQDHEV